MVWYPAYISDKQEIVDWIIDQRPDAVTGMISDTNTKVADIQVWSQLMNEGITVNYTGVVSGSAAPIPADINYFLWAASLAYNLEFLAMRGTIHFTHGGIESTQFGKQTNKFMRMQPMFFIPQAGGGSILDDVMPFRSYKQMAQSFIKAYIKAYYMGLSGTMISPPQVSFDTSSRGYGWNMGTGYRVNGDYLSSGLR
jgi:hypothetical protein